MPIMKRTMLHASAAASLSLASFVVTSCSEPQWTDNPGNMTDIQRPMEPPKDVVVWKIRFYEKPDATINIEYDVAARHTLAAGESIDTYLDKVARGELPLQATSPAEPKKPNTWRKPNWDDSRLTEKRRERVSTLSVEHKGYSYIIFVLDDETNWEFMPEKEPIRIDKKGEGLYFNPRCTYLPKDSPSAKTTRVPPKGEICRVASFIAKSEEEPLEQDGSFTTPFNLYVRLTYNVQGRPRQLPLIIDPDVGYPGGNAP